MVKLAVVAPAGTVTVAGTCRTPLFADNGIGSPPVGAADAIVTVPVDDDPPLNVVGFALKPVNAGAGVKVIATDFWMLFQTALTARVDVVATAFVWMTKSTVVCPSKTITELGGTR